MKKKYILAISIAVVFLVFFFGVFFKGKTLSSTAITPAVVAEGVYNYNGHVMKTLPLKDPGAFSWHHFPLMRANEFAYKNFELPLWNPYSGSGQPLVADQQSSGFSPLHLPLFFNSSLFMWDLFMIFRLFIAFIFTYLFARRLKLRREPSFLAAFIFAFCSYFWFFITMNHLTVEVLIPAVFYFSERFLQDIELKNVAGLASVYGLIILGGMPESSFLLFVVSSIYIIVRIISKDYKEKDRSTYIKDISFWLIALAVGAFLAAIMILPLLEYLQNSLHGHGTTVGLTYLPKTGLVDLFIPNFTWPGVNWLNMNRHHAFNYVGVLPLVLAFMVKKKGVYAWFFIGLAFMYVAKAFGLPVINNLGSLPFLKAVYYPKYFSAYFAFSVAILAGITLNSYEKLSYRRILSAVSIWALAATLIIIYFRQIIIDKGMVKEVAFRFFTPFAVIVLFVLAYYLFRKKVINLKTATYVVIVIVIAEMFVYLPNERSSRHDPSNKPPYINYVLGKQKEEEPFRILALDKLLFPNYSAVFKIEDIRLLNALLIDRYRNFADTFVSGIAVGHFTGFEVFDFNSRLIDLTNTKYIISSTSLKGQMTKKMARSTKPKPAYSKAGDGSVVIKNAGRYEYSVAVPYTASGLVFKAAAKNSAKLTVSSSAGAVKDIDLSKELKEFDIDIQSQGGAPVTTVFDANFSEGEVKITDVHYKSKAKNRIDRFKLVYDKDVKIYENTEVMPRAFVAYNYEEKPDANNVLGRVVDGSEDLKRTVFLEEKLNESFAKKNIKPTKAEVKQKGQNTLKVEVSNPYDGLLFLGDNYYPGWKAFVNGKEAKIYRANYTFRAVPVKKGKNIVEFIYKPASFIWGAILSAIGLIVIIVFFFVRREGPRLQ